MAGSQSNNNGSQLSHKDMFNIVYALSQGHAMCFVPFIRKNFGGEALRPGVIALVIMVAVGSLGRILDMWAYLGLWAFVMLIHRANSEKAKQQGIIRHSRYEGDVDTTIFKKRWIAKQVGEPLFCIFAGVCVQAMGLSHELAVFVGSGAFSLGLVAMIDRQLEERRVQAMRDAAIEQSYLAARFRGEADES